MCGRYVTPEMAAMEREYALTARQVEAWINTGFDRNYNTSPTQSVPILRVIRDLDGERQLEPMRWGLVPYWAKGVPPKYTTINAMVETLESKPTYRAPWRKGQRCIFPTAGFYEWQVLPDGSKAPHYITPSGDDELFHIGGLWDRSMTEDGKEVLSCTIITMPANELMGVIHNAKQRMPLILNKEDIDVWLGGTVEQAHELLLPYPSELMRATRVSTRVNSPKNNGEDLICSLADDATDYPATQGNRREMLGRS